MSKVAVKNEKKCDPNKLTITIRGILKKIPLPMEIPRYFHDHELSTRGILVCLASYHLGINPRAKSKSSF